MQSERLKRAKDVAEEWQKRTGEGPGTQGGMNAYLAGYFGHSLFAAKPVQVAVVETYEAALIQIADLERRLAATEWKAITPNALPTLEDEVGMFSVDNKCQAAARVADHQRAWTFHDWTTRSRATHFRPIASPPEPRGKA
jgi:hypothetical protein